MCTFLAYIYHITLVTRQDMSSLESLCAWKNHTTRQPYRYRFLNILWIVNANFYESSFKRLIYEKSRLPKYVISVYLIIHMFTLVLTLRIYVTVFKWSFCAHFGAHFRDKTNILRHHFVIHCYAHPLCSSILILRHLLAILLCMSPLLFIYFFIHILFMDFVVPHAPPVSVRAIAIF